MMKWYQVVLRYYASQIKEAAAKDNESFGVLRYSRMRGHLKWMCEEALTFTDGEKACTWLGFIQGSMAVMGECTCECTTKMPKMAYLSTRRFERSKWILSTVFGPPYARV